MRANQARRNLRQEFKRMGTVDDRVDRSLSRFDHTTGEYVHKWAVSVAFTYRQQLADAKRYKRNGRNVYPHSLDPRWLNDWN